MGKRCSPRAIRGITQYPGTREEQITGANFEIIFNFVRIWGEQVRRVPAADIQVRPR